MTNNKKLASYTFSEEARNALTKIAAQNKRSRTSQLEWMIEQEYKKLSDNQNTKETN